MTDNAIEYGGIKLSGSKLLIIIPLLTTISGGLWGGFELYNRLLKAEDSLNAIDPPAISAEIKRMESVYTLIKDDVTNQITQLKENNEKDIARLRDEIGLIDDRNSEINTMVKKSEADLSASERELRDDVYGMEKEMQKSFKDMDVNIKQVRTDLELRIKEILTNPLNNGSK